MGKKNKITYHICGILISVLALTSLLIIPTFYSYAEKVQVTSEKTNAIRVTSVASTIDARTFGRSSNISIDGQVLSTSALPYFHYYTGEGSQTWLTEDNSVTTFETYLQPDDTWGPTDHGLSTLVFEMTRERYLSGYYPNYDVSVRETLKVYNNGNLIYSPAMRQATFRIYSAYISVPANQTWGKTITTSEEVSEYYAPVPIINANKPFPASSGTAGYTAILTLPESEDINEVLTPTLTFNPSRGIYFVVSGYSNVALNLQEKTSDVLPNNENYYLETMSGAPMNDGQRITGIGKTRWVQRVTDYSGEKTQFARNITIKTNQAPNISVEYAQGPLAGTPYTNGNANGGIEGWSNQPLKVTVNTKKDDGTYLVEGYYYNQLSDDQGGVLYGAAQKGEASQIYSNNTTTISATTGQVGKDITGALVDELKTTVLSGTTLPSTIRIDVDAPNASATYNSTTKTLENTSVDVGPSGLRATMVAIVPTGQAAPQAGEYVPFDDWQSCFSRGGEYDIYIMATDKAGNTSSNVLRNQTLAGRTTDLKISKTVEGKYGDYNKAFEVTVSLKNAAGDPFNGNYNVSSTANGVNDYQIEFIGGNAKVNIRHGETITIKELSVGDTYTVKETDAITTNGAYSYTTTYNGAESNVGVTQTLGDGVAQVAIKNLRETIPETGIRKVDFKTVVGAGIIILVALYATYRYYAKRGKRSW